MKLPFPLRAGFITVCAGLGFFFILSVSGCRSRSEHFSRIINEPAPPPEKVRAQFGVIGLLPVDSSAPFQVRRPANRGEAAVLMATQAFDKTIRITSRDADEDEEETVMNYKTGELKTKYTRPEEELKDDAGSFVVSLLVSHVALFGGALGGMFAGVPEAEIQRGEKMLRAAHAERSPDARLGQELQAIAERQHARNFIVLPPEFNASRAGETNWPPAALPPGVDSVLRCRVVDQQFIGRRGVNPPMTFALNVELQVRRATDGAVLYSRELDYRGARRRFTAWAEEDARRFRHEMTRASKILATVIAEQLAAP